MDIANQLRIQFCSEFGAESDLVVGHINGRARCSLMVLLSPRMSREHTEQDAWSLVARVAEWAAAREADFGFPEKVEIMVALPKAVREVKRRILRVAGSVDQWRNMLRSKLREPIGEGSYVYYYSEWADGVQSWI